MPYDQGQDIKALTPDQLRALRKEVAYTFQHANLLGRNCPLPPQAGLCPPQGADVSIPSDPTKWRVPSVSWPSTSSSPLVETATPLLLTTSQKPPKNLTFTPISLLNLNEAYITKIGLTPADNGLIFEEVSDNTVAVFQRCVKITRTATRSRQLKKP